jgi:hypothetical protein
MGCFLLIGLGESVPMLGIGVKVGVPSDEWFFLVDADDLDHFCPLIYNISLIVSFDDCGFDVVIVVYTVSHFHVVVEDHIAAG